MIVVGCALVSGLVWPIEELKTHDRRSCLILIFLQISKSTDTLEVLERYRPSSAACTSPRSDRKRRPVSRNAISPYPRRDGKADPLARADSN